MTKEERFEWYNALVKMPNDVFLKSISAALGKIKTPYNKQHLLEALEHHLCKKETQEAIVRSLTDAQKEILTAIMLLPHSKAEVIFRMLDYSFGIARRQKAYSKMLCDFIVYQADEVLHIAPPLLSAIAPLKDIRMLIPLRPLARVPEASGAQPLVSPVEIAALVSFVMAHKKVLKADDTFAVTAKRDIKEQFQSPPERLEVLLHSMINLQLINDEDTLLVDFDAMKAFASLSAINQAALLCAASSVQYIPDIPILALVLLDCAASVGESWIEAEPLCTMGTILLEKAFAPCDDALSPASCYGGGREATSCSDEMLDVFNAMLFNAFVLGYVDIKEGIYHFNLPEDGHSSCEATSLSPARCFGGCEATSLSPASCFGGCASQRSFKRATNMSMDASFTITVMPETPLKAMLDIVPFVTLLSCQTAAEFAITRESATRAFDAGLTVEDIRHRTKGFAAESLIVSLEGWYEAYKAATLYHGYVLCLNEEAARRLEHCTTKGTVWKKLGDGVYLLCIDPVSAPDKDAKALLLAQKCGFVNIAKVHTPQNTSPRGNKSLMHSLPVLREGRSIFEGGVLSGGER